MARPAADSSRGSTQRPGKNHVAGKKAGPQPAPPGCGLSTSATAETAAVSTSEDNHYKIVMIRQEKFLNFFSQVAFLLSRPASKKKRLGIARNCGIQSRNLRLSGARRSHSLCQTTELFPGGFSPVAMVRLFERARRFFRHSIRAVEQ
jgi:hypothetical protein